MALPVTDGKAEVGLGILKPLGHKFIQKVRYSDTPLGGFCGADQTDTFLSETDVSLLFWSWMQNV